MKKTDLLDKLRYCRKKYGKDSKETMKAIFNLTKFFPYYDGYHEHWVRNNNYNV